MMPDIFNSKLPGLSRVSSSELVRRNLEAKKKASEEFIKIVDCEKVKRALSSNVRDTKMDKINIGDEVYYKRNDSEEWHGPGKVMLLEKKYCNSETSWLYPESTWCKPGESTRRNLRCCKEAV